MRVSTPLPPAPAEVGPAGAEPGPALRWARGSAVGTVATGLALLGHVAAGGAAPPGRDVLLLAAVAALVCVALSGRRWTWAPLLGVLVSAQIAFHVTFANLAMPSAVHGDADEPALVHVVGPAGLPAPTGMSHHGHSGLVMLCAHSAAAVATAWLLRRGEDLCWRVLDLLVASGRAVRAAVLPAVPSPAELSPVAAGATTLSLTVLRHAVARRGPPRQPAA
jgi:hypothetical protein